MFTLEVNQGTESRTEWGQDGATLWSNDDKIYVTSEDGTVTGVLTYQGSNSFKGFVYGGDASKLTHVLYPVPENGQIKINQPTGNKIGLPMMGELNNNKTGATLDNLCALVQMPVDGADKLTLGDKGGMLTGHYEYNDGEIVFVPGEGEVVISVVDGSALFATSTQDEDGNVVSEVEFTVKGSEETYVVPVTQGQIETEDVPNIEISGGKVDATMNVTTPEILEMALNQYDEVKLAGNITIKESIEIAADKQTTLDLNGFALAGTINNGGTLTVVNTEINLESVSSFTVDGGTTLIKGGIYDFNVTAAQGFAAFSMDGSNYIVLPQGFVVVKNDAELIENVNAGISNLFLMPGEYVMPNLFDVEHRVDLRNKKLMIIGTRDAEIDASGVNENDQFVTGATLVFEGVTLNFSKTKRYMGFANTESLTYRGCFISGLQFLYGNSVVFENCVLDSRNNTVEPHSVWTYGAKNVTFTGCTHYYGNRAVNCYKDQNIEGGKQIVNFEECTFITADEYSKGGVEINSSAFSIGIEVNLNGCTAPEYGDMVGISGWDSTGGEKTTVKIDGSTFNAPQWTK